MLYRGSNNLSYSKIPLFMMTLNLNYLAARTIASLSWFNILNTLPSCCCNENCYPLLADRETVVAFYAAQALDQQVFSCNGGNVWRQVPVLISVSKYLPLSMDLLEAECVTNHRCSVTRVLMRKFQRNKEAYFGLIKRRGDWGQDNYWAWKIYSAATP